MKTNRLRKFAAILISVAHLTLIQNAFAEENWVATVGGKYRPDITYDQAFGLFQVLLTDNAIEINDEAIDRIVDRETARITAEFNAQPDALTPEESDANRSGMVTFQIAGGRWRMSEYYYGIGLKRLRDDLKESLLEELEELQENYLEVAKPVAARAAADLRQNLNSMRPRFVMRGEFSPVPGEGWQDPLSKMIDDVPRAAARQLRIELGTASVQPEAFHVQLPAIHIPVRASVKLTWQARAGFMFSGRGVVQFPGLNPSTVTSDRGRITFSYRLVPSDNELMRNRMNYFAGYVFGCEHLFLRFQALAPPGEE